MTQPDTRSHSPVGDVVHRRILPLQNGVRANRSAEVAALARLRRALGKPAGSVADVLQYTLDKELVQPGAGDDPTFAERAAHLALTLYAAHQQGNGQPMHVRGREHYFGTAIRRLAPRELEPSPVLRRFRTFGTSVSFEELTHHARGFVQQLRAAHIPVDYQHLADQFYWWQSPQGPERVRLAWGREFYLGRHTEETTDQQQEQ